MAVAAGKGTVCVLGGTGFVGRAIAAKLTRAGYAVRIPTRNRQRARRMLILPGLELAIMHLLLAAFFALTIIGIPLAAQHIKLLPLALLPFGRGMRDIETGRTYP